MISTVPFYDHLVHGFYIWEWVVGFFFVIACIYAFIFGWRFAERVLNDAKVATTPLPTPQEIAVKFYEEVGREPTIEEVASIQQMLRNQKTEATTNALLGAGLLYGAYRIGQHQ